MNTPKKSLSPVQDDSWGWTSYRRTGWRTEERREYKAKFRTEGDAIHGFSEVTIRFLARFPILALRTIAESGRDPSEYHGLAIN